MFKIYASGIGTIYDDTLVYSDSSENIIREPSLSMEESKAGSLTFIIGASSPLYDQIELFRPDIWVTRTINDVEEIIWLGRVLEEERDYRNDRTITCEGALAFLNDTIQPQYYLPPLCEGSYEFLEDMLNYHNSLMTNENHKFYISDETRTSSYSKIVQLNGEGLTGALSRAVFQIATKLDRGTTLSNIMEQFVDRWGGQIRLKHVMQPDGSIKNYIDYFDSYSTDRELSNQSVEFGINLISIKKTASAEDFATVLIPLGRSLTNLEKTFPYYQSQSNGTIKVIDSDPANPSSANYITGKYINKDTGALVSTSDTNYVVLPDVSVGDGWEYYLTTFLKSFGNNDASPVTYVVLNADKDKVLSSGETVSCITENNQTTETEKQFTDVQITIPTNGSFLRVAAYKPTEKGVTLKRVNTSYTEERQTILSVNPALVPSYDDIEKPYYYNKGEDVYPIATSDFAHYKEFEKARMIFNTNLIADFGNIIKIYEYQQPDYGTPEDLFRSVAPILSSMTEKVEFEIGALDTSYIDSAVSPFCLLDRTRIFSEPNNVDAPMVLTNIELPLSDPKSAEYTFRSTEKQRNGEPKYISEYMAQTYKKGAG